MTTLEKIETVLFTNTVSPGITASAIAKATGVSRTEVMKRISDLRVLYGLPIFSNTRKFQGRNKVYYRLAA